MKFNPQNSKCALAHILLSDLKLAVDVAETQKWKDEEIVEAKLTFNGVEVGAEVLEKKLHQWMEQMQEMYSPEGIEEQIEKEVERRIKERAENVLEQLQKLENVLQDANSLIKPYWER